MSQNEEDLVVRIASGAGVCLSGEIPAAVWCSKKTSAAPSTLCDQMITMESSAPVSHKAAVVTRVRSLLCSPGWDVPQASTVHLLTISQVRSKRRCNSKFKFYTISAKLAKCL